MFRLALYCQFRNEEKSLHLHRTKSILMLFFPQYFCCLPCFVALCIALCYWRAVVCCLWIDDRHIRRCSVFRFRWENQHNTSVTDGPRSKKKKEKRITLFLYKSVNLKIWKTFADCIAFMILFLFFYISFWFSFDLLVFSIFLFYLSLPNVSNAIDECISFRSQHQQPFRLLWSVKNRIFFFENRFLLFSIFVLKFILCMIVENMKKSFPSCVLIPMKLHQEKIRKKEKNWMHFPIPIEVDIFLNSLTFIWIIQR